MNMFLFFCIQICISNSLRSPALHSSTLVVAHHSEGLSWLKYVEKGIVETIYIISSSTNDCDDLISSLSKLRTKIESYSVPIQPQIICESIPNYGCEAGAYLHYLSTHYNNLADHTLFLHAHRDAWHNKMWLNPSKGRWKPMHAEEIVSNHDWNMNLSYVFSYYMRIQQGSSKARRTAKIFPNEMMGADLDVPGSAQFGVSRIWVQQYPHSTYEKWYKEAVSKFCGPAHSAGRGFSNTWEILWPIVFAPLEYIQSYSKTECSNRVWFRKHINFKKKRGLTKKEAARRSKKHEAPLLVSS